MVDLEQFLLARARRGVHACQNALLDLGKNMSGTTICVLSDSCATPVVSGLAKFRHEFEAKIQTAERVTT